MRKGLSWMLPIVGVFVFMMGMTLGTVLPNSRDAQWISLIFWIGTAYAVIPLLKKYKAYASLFLVFATATYTYFSGAPDTNYLVSLGFLVFGLWHLRKFGSPK